MLPPMEKRIKIYPLLFILAYIIAYTFKFAFSPETRLQKDFAVFYAAAKAAAAGNVIEIYNIEKFQPFVEQIVGQLNGISPWLYPPIFLLVISQLAILPYLPAMFIWLFITFFGYILVVRKIAPHPDIYKLVLGFSASYINFDLGQNGFLSAFLLGAGLLLLEKHPLGAGILFGFISFKPQLVLLVIIALVFAQMWRALAAVIATVIILAGSSIVLYGITSWHFFYCSIPFAQSLLENGRFPIVLMPTVYGFVRLLGGSNTFAYCLQVIFFILAIGIVGFTWYHRIFPMAYIILTVSIFFATPYAMLYDLTILGLTIAWYGWYAFKQGWFPGEKEVLILAWFMPLFAQEIAIHTKIQVMPVILFAIIILSIRRIQIERSNNK